MTDREQGTTHDYTRRGWGRDYTFSPKDAGRRGRMTGWGVGIRKGDFLILPNGDSTTRYRVRRIRYFLNPSDQWAADVIFWPRGRKMRHAA